MATQSSDSKKTPAPNLTTVDTQQLAPEILPDEVCRVFISRKTMDQDIMGDATEDRRQLVSLVGKASDGKTDRLQFFDAELIPLGVDWRRKIRAEIKRADILLLVLTKPAQDHFDWPLYEAGLFDSLREDGRLVCFYPEYGEPPDQVKDMQGVKASQKNILKFLKNLFTDNEFTNTLTPLKSDAFDTFSDLMIKIATRVYERINGAGDALPEVTYANPYIQLILKPGSSMLTEDVEIKSERVPLRTLFNLNMKPRLGDNRTSKDHWTWGDIEEAVDLGDKDPMNFNELWMREAEAAVRLLLQGKSEDRQIRGRFIAKDDRIWGPEIQISRAYNNGMMTVDIAFSPGLQEVWLKKAKAQVALGANLNLAVQIRHDLLETYLRRLPHWQDGEADRFSELKEHIQVVEQEGFFIRWLTKEPWEEAFDPDEVEKVVGLERAFGENIHPKLRAALEDRNVKEATAALKLWRDNNAEFLSIGIPQYTKLLRLET